MLCLSFYVFFNWPGDSKHLGSARRQADEYIAPGGKFFYVFMCLILPIWTRLVFDRQKMRGGFSLLALFYSLLCKASQNLWTFQELSKNFPGTTYFSVVTRLIVKECLPGLEEWQFLSGSQEEWAFARVLRSMYRTTVHCVLILSAWPVLVLIYHVLVLVGRYFGQFFEH